MMEMMTGSMVAWMLAWAVLILGLVVFGFVWIARRGLTSTREAERPPPQVEGAENAPYEILRRRYAAGEIDEDEYLTRLSGLSQR